MNQSNNLAVLPVGKGDNTDTDGEDGNEVDSFQLTIDVVENGFVLSKSDSEGLNQKVFLFNGIGDNGPKALIQEAIDFLGITDKVKIVK